MSTDDEFLKKNWGSLQKAMRYLVKSYDKDEDGILTGAQYNTLDAHWHGKIAWLSLLYNAALKASEQMALEMNDQDFAAFCRDLANKGRQGIENKLFHGEYIVQLADDGPGT